MSEILEFELNAENKIEHLSKVVKAIAGIAPQKLKAANLEDTKTGKSYTGAEALSEIAKVLNDVAYKVNNC